MTRHETGGRYARILRSRSAGVVGLGRKLLFRMCPGKCCRPILLRAFFLTLCCAVFLRIERKMMWVLQSVTRYVISGKKSCQIKFPRISRSKIWQWIKPSVPQAPANNTYRIRVEIAPGSPYYVLCSSLIDISTSKGKSGLVNIFTELISCSNLIERIFLVQYALLPFDICVQLVCTIIIYCCNRASKQLVQVFTIWITC